MAKKKTTGPETPAPSTPAAPRRTSSTTGTRRRAVSTSASPAEPVSAAPVEIDRAAEMSVVASTDVIATSQPSFSEIAEAAYHRYLERGGGHGRDFDDWVEAERGLRTRE